MDAAIEWVKMNGPTLLAAWGALVAAASAVVKLTPSQRDDAILAKVVGFLDHFSVFNPNKPKA